MRVGQTNADDRAFQQVSPQVEPAENSLCTSFSTTDDHSYITQMWLEFFTLAFQELTGFKISLLGLETILTKLINVKMNFVSDF